MSDLQRQFARSKLANLPQAPPEAHDAEETSDHFADLAVEHVVDDDSSSSASSASSTGTIRPAVSSNLFARPHSSANKRSYEQRPWTAFFERDLLLETSQDSSVVSHHVYLTSPTGSAPLFVTHHGAGSSGLSFASLTLEIRKLLPGAGILSLDARGHGLTAVSDATTEPGAPSTSLDLSLGTLSSDLVTVIQKTKQALSWEPMPPLVLIGHSLGGAVVTDVAKNGKLGDKVLGYAVLDVVEGSAIEALQSMQNYLSTRPLGFPSLESGVEWHVRSRTIRNSSSARASVPALLVLDPEAQPARCWTWRTNLAATQPFWEGWFAGLSKKFLEAKGGKLLLLAGTDRLDRELMIGQMQGKFALQIYPEAGHFIHEDLPEKVAISVVDFYKRNDQSAMVLPPKVSEMLKAGRYV